ncbi:U3 small nucleolar ribonucleoprotein LCP5, partial [Lecanoromycetidae sp. Uapishka_2]
MAATATLPALLSTLTESLTSASASLPSSETIAPPPEGISLLDTKNELLLSYLHNLVFLIILKVRHHSSSPADEEAPSLNNAVTQKLVELRIYLEKGVRPLESRLKYQLDKLLLAASEAALPPIVNGATKQNRTKAADDASASDSDTEPTLPAQSSEQIYPAEKEKKGLYKPPRITPTALPTTERRGKLTKPRKSHTLDDFIREEMDDAPVAEPSIGAGSGLRGREK